MKRKSEADLFKSHSVVRPSEWRALVLTGLSLALTLTANAQWTVVNLHPAGATESLATAVRDGRQVGAANVGGRNCASLWSGTADSWVNLHPAGASESIARDVDGGQQAGSALVGGNETQVCGAAPPSRG